MLRLAGAFITINKPKKNCMSFVSFSFFYPAMRRHVFMLKKNHVEMLVPPFFVPPKFVVLAMKKKIRWKDFTLVKKV